MTKKKSYLILILCLVTSLIFSQTTNEDDFYIKKIIEFNNSNNDSLIYYSSKLKKSKKISNFYYALNVEAKAYYQKGDLDLAKEKILYVLEKLKDKNELPLTRNKINALNRLFWIYKNQNKFQEAFDIVLQRKKIIKSLGIKDSYYKANLISTENNLALIKSILGHHEEARVILKDILLRSPLIYKDLNYSDNYVKLNNASILNIIGESFLESSLNQTSNDLDSAYIYFEKAYNVAKTLNPPHKNSKKLYQLRIAEILIAKDQFKEALSIIQQNESNNDVFRVKQLINSLKVICFYQLKNNDSTLYFGKQFLKEHNKKTIFKKSLISVYDILANQYFKNKQLDSAYKYSELTISELNILNKNKNEVTKSSYLYDFKNAQELNKLILNKSKTDNNNNITLIFIIIILGITTFFFLYKKNKKTSKHLVKVKSEMKDKPISQKKEYNIDRQLESTILKGINELEKSTDFLDPNFSIKVLSKKINTNTTYLSYIINKNFSQSFKQYITKLRIEYLIKQLSEGNNKYRNYTIKSLAEEIGYTNASAFTRAFKKYKGITPSEFIKSLS